MAQSLKLLLVCVPADVVPKMREVLARRGCIATIERVMGAGLMRAALMKAQESGAEPWSAVIAGCEAPAFPPLAALCALREISPDMPFVALVPANREEVGAEVVERGGQDYVLAESMGRLPHTLLREVSSAHERKDHALTEGRLRTSEQLFRLMAENAKDFLYRYRLRPVPSFEYVSPSVVNISGYTAEEHYANPELMHKLVHPEDQPFLLQALQSPVSQNGPLLLRWVRRDGQMTWTEQTLVRSYDADGTVVAVEGIVRDVTRRIRAEQALQRKTQELERTLERLYQVQEQLVQSSKLAALGQFAAGMAHDFNNLLTPIMGFSDLASRHLPPDHRVSPYVREIGSTCRRAASLIRQLLAFAGQQPVQPRTIDMNERVCALGTILRSLVGEHISVLTATGADNSLVSIDPCQLEQLLINLSANARDAMPDGGLLTIETTNVTLDAEFCQGRGNLQPGDYVRLSVKDTGRGIDAATRSRIFEPFFTTKSNQNGTGLGLSICHGVVHQAGGYIQVESQLGQGTTFHAYLPKMHGAPEECSAIPEDAELPRGSERVLLVEDEPLVRALAADLLRTQGYEVTEAQDGQEALKVVGTPGNEFQLLVTDVVMPRMSGKALVDQVMLARPETRVLFISGYPDGMIEGQGL